MEPLAAIDRDDTAGIPLDEFSDLRGREHQIAAASGQAVDLDGGGGSVDGRRSNASPSEPFSPLAALADAGASTAGTARRDEATAGSRGGDGRAGSVDRDLDSLGGARVPKFHTSNTMFRRYRFNPAKRNVASSKSYDFMTSSSNLYATSQLNR